MPELCLSVLFQRSDAESGSTRETARAAAKRITEPSGGCELAWFGKRARSARTPTHHSLRWFHQNETQEMTSNLGALAHPHFLCVLGFNLCARQTLYPHIMTAQ